MSRTRKAGGKGTKKRSKRRRGGMAQLLNQAIVPFGLTYLATRKRRRGSKRRGGSRSRRGGSRSKRGGENEHQNAGRRKRRRRGSKRRRKRRRKRRGSKRR